MPSSNDALSLWNVPEVWCPQGPSWFLLGNAQVEQRGSQPVSTGRFIHPQNSSDADAGRGNGAGIELEGLKPGRMSEPGQDEEARVAPTVFSSREGAAPEAVGVCGHRGDATKKH